MSDENNQAEVAAPQGRVADLKEIITAVQMSAFDIGSVRSMIATSRITARTSQAWPGGRP